MRPFFRFFAERHILASLTTLMILILGVSTLSYIKRDIYPKVELGEVIVTTVYPGASPEDVELNVTNKIEDELEGVSGLKKTTSFSMENVSVIVVSVDPDGGDRDEIIDDVREAVSRVTDFPEEVTEEPLVEQWKTSMLPIVEVGISGDLPYRELRELAKSFEDRLLGLSGVSRVEKFGYRAREVKVEVSPRAIANYQIPLGEVIAAIQWRNIRATAGSFESYTSEKNVVTLAQFRSPQEVGDVIVRSTFDGPLIKIKDLAIVRDDFEEEKILSRMNGKTAISFNVIKTEAADIIRTVDEIKELAALESERLPEGVEIIFATDMSRSVRNRFEVVRSNLLIGLVLVLAVLAFFLNLRTAFWVALGIPVALLGTVFLLPLLGFHLDSVGMSAMLLMIGIIVDDAIIIAENIFRHRERGLAPIEAAVEGIREVFAPVVATMLTTFLAFAPMFFMPGLMGEFVLVIPVVVTLALLVSLGEAIVALPAHITGGLHKWKKRPSARIRWFNRMRERYARFARGLLRIRYLLVPVFAAVLLVAVWYAMNFMDFVLMPGGMADSFYIFTEYPTGTSLEASSDRTAKIEEIVAALPDEELASFKTRVGWNPFLDAVSEHYAAIAVDLTPFATRERSAEQIVEELREKSEEFDDEGRTVFLIETGGPPVGRPITIRVVGTDDDLRATLADSVQAYLGKMEGVQDIERDDKPGKEQVEVKIDYDRVARLGLSVSEIARTIRIAYDGEVVTSVRYGDEDVDFRVLLQEARHRDVGYLRQIRVPNRQGRLIPLGDFARLTVGPGPSDFRHYNGTRAITVDADIAEGSDLTPLVATDAVVERFGHDPDRWQGMEIVVGGEAQETAESMTALFMTLVLAVVAIYFLLIILFNSLTQPLFVLVAIPFGISGVIAAFALHGQTLGFMAVLGIIGLSGVVVNDSLVLVSHLNDLRRERPDAPTVDIVAEGTSDRLRPIIMTTLTIPGWRRWRSRSGTASCSRRR
jgi:multidrug efflux pump subunit AcrB